MDWANLPSDLLTRIAGILDLDIADRIRFASVCKPWHSSLKSSSSSLLPQIRLPWLVISPFTTNANCLTAFTLFSPNPYSLPLPATATATATATVDLTLFAASNGFFFAFNDVSCCSSLINPIARSQIELPDLVVPIQAVERCKVVSTARGSFAVMVSLSFGLVMVCCREMGGGGRNDDWTALCGDVNVDYVSDFVYFGGFYYVLDEKESETYVVDPEEKRVVMVVPSVGRDRPFHPSDRYA